MTALLFMLKAAKTLVYILCVFLVKKRQTYIKTFHVVESLALLK